jgi:NADPH-dependent 7-cyano-7-deazaguanine reductase QueF
MTVEGDFYLRGGIHTTVTATHEAPVRRKPRPRR